MCPEVARTTLRQLLTMTAGLRADPLSGEPLASTLHGNWVSDILQHGFAISRARGPTRASRRTSWLPFWCA